MLTEEQKATVTSDVLKAIIDYVEPGHIIDVTLDGNPRYSIAVTEIKEEYETEPLTEHCIFAIWDENGTEIVSFHLCEKEAQKQKNDLETSDLREKFILAKYFFSETIK